MLTYVILFKYPSFQFVLAQRNYIEYENMKHILKYSKLKMNFEMDEKLY